MIFISEKRKVEPVNPATDVNKDKNREKFYPRNLKFHPYWYTEEMRREDAEYLKSNHEKFKDVPDNAPFDQFLQKASQLL